MSDAVQIALITGLALVLSSAIPSAITILGNRVAGKKLDKIHEDTNGSLTTALDEIKSLKATVAQLVKEKDNR